MKVMLSGGGTGGHIYPALAVADALKARHGEIDILFVGAEGKMEMKKVAEKGYKIVGLTVRGLQRRLTWSNIKVPFLLLQSIRKAASLLKDFRPDVVAGFGGYASAPTLYMAQRMGIPTLLQEQNSHAGLTNRYLGKNADLICVAYGHMEKYFPEEKIQRTGNPVREEWLTQNVENIGSEFNRVQYKKTLLLFGGSLGAKTLNEAMKSSAKRLQNQPDIGILWQCGKSYFDDYNDCETAQLPNVQLMPYIDDMRAAYAAADLVVCRAGALTISELALLGKPAVLVPSPNVSEDHQTKNAQALTAEGAAWMVQEAEAREELIPFALKCMENETELYEKQEAIKQFSPKGATEKIVDRIVALAQNRQI